MLKPCIQSVRPLALATWVAGCLAIALPAGTVFADTLEIRGTIRDFHSSHPDMEATIANDRGIVEEILGTDARPVYAHGEEGTVTTHGPEAFDQWYHDVEGVNLRTDYVLVLENTVGEPTVFNFHDSSFFPIDGELFGNEENSHNYHFTMDIHAHFTYEGGETFYFSGDDDLWLFLNGALVIDLGGIHSVENDEVALDDVAEEIGLVTGETYDFDLFFAERHTVASNFQVTTSIVFLPPKEGDEDDVDAIVDNCPFHNNDDQADADDDFKGDVCDNCPETANRDQSDVDEDGVGDVCDNCPTVANPDQENLDEDAWGDACDDDADGDGAPAEEDCDDMNPNVSTEILVYEDPDGDGYGDTDVATAVCSDEVPEGFSSQGGDTCPGVSNPDQRDDDLDGVGNACDECPDQRGPVENGGCPYQEIPDDVLDRPPDAGEDMGFDAEMGPHPDAALEDADVSAWEDTAGDVFEESRVELVYPEGRVSGGEEGCECRHTDASPRGFLAGFALLAMALGVRRRRG